MNENIDKPETGVPADLPTTRQQIQTYFFKKNIIVNLINNEIGENT
jgi:hypothetical protein